MNWEAMQHVYDSPIRSKILFWLDTPRTPKKLAKLLGVSLSQISVNVKKLVNDKTVKCLNPAAVRNRFYKRTKLGDEIVSYLKDEGRLDSQGNVK